MGLISQNISELRADIEAICKECGRNADEVTIVAVSKTKPVEMMREAIGAGINNFGENYIKEAEEKFGQLKDGNNQAVKFHFIGSVQTNKVKHITGFCSLLHSLDREGLVEALQKRLEFEGKNMNCLIQVNTSGEATKSGMEPEKIIEFAKFISKHDRIKIKGLMTIAENTDDKNEIRKNFKQLKSLLEELKVLHLPNSEMKELSMGMSSDYRIAIEEGATMVRIGSTIFGARDYSDKAKNDEGDQGQKEGENSGKKTGGNLVVEATGNEAANEAEKTERNPAGKTPKKYTPNGLERFIYKNTPQPVKDWVNRIIDRLPPRTAHWIRNNKFFTLCIVYAIRGLFFRPTMWAVYAAIAAYFGWK